MGTLIVLLYAKTGKLIFCLKPSDEDRFVEYAAQSFPEEFETCSNAINHKTIFFNPFKLVKDGFDVVCIFQTPGTAASIPPGKLLVARHNANTICVSLRDF